MTMQGFLLFFFFRNMLPKLKGLKDKVKKRNSQHFCLLKQSALLSAPMFLVVQIPKLTTVHAHLRAKEENLQTKC